MGNRPDFCIESGFFVLYNRNISLSRRARAVFIVSGGIFMQGKQRFMRRLIYLVGMLVLALGLILNIKAGLGSSAIMSMAYTVSEGAGLNLGNMTFILYAVFVAAQLILNGRPRQWAVLLQLPLSFIFTRFMNLFKDVIPYQSGFLPTDLLVLLLAILLTGIGAAMTVDMQLIPNPGDGIVSSVARRFGWELGFAKNCFDLGCVSISLVMGFAFGNALLGIGLGTVISMIGVGRVIAVFNRVCKVSLLKAAGLEQ